MSATGARLLRRRIYENSLVKRKRFANSSHLTCGIDVPGGTLLSHPQRHFVPQNTPNSMAQGVLPGVPRVTKICRVGRRASAVCLPPHPGMNGSALTDPAVLI